MNRTVALVIAKAALGAGLALGFAAAPHGTAHAEPATGHRGGLAAVRLPL
jgi:hypothetical protein